MGIGDNQKKSKKETFSGSLSSRTSSKTSIVDPIPIRILTDAQVIRLKEHKYNCECTSILDPYLQPYWNWLVLKLPIWISPNLLTIIGLIINILTSLVVIYFSPDCKQHIPAWSLILCAIGLFFYQSLDAVDGKQARRTKTSSPMGELFDHGCDSVSTVFVSLALCAALRLGESPKLLFLQSFMAVFLFYCAHWQTYVTGLLKFGWFDVTEAQVCIMIIHILTAIFGGEIWTKTVPGLGYPVYTIYVITALAGALLTLHGEFKTIIYKGAGKNGSSIAGTSVLSPIFPFAFVAVPAIMIASRSEQGIFENDIAIFTLTFGLIIAKVTNRLVVAHMTKSKLELWDPALLGPVLLFMNQYFGTILSERYLLYFSLVWVTYEICRYSRAVCLEICESLGIHLFKMPNAIKVQEKYEESVHSLKQSSKLHQNLEKGGGDAELTVQSNNPNVQSKGKAKK